MIQSFISSLRKVCLEKPDNELADTLWFEPTAVELADAVWLATQIGLSTERQIKSARINAAVSQPEDIPTPLTSDDIEPSEQQVILQPEVDISVAPEYLSKNVSESPITEEKTDSQKEIKVTEQQKKESKESSELESKTTSQDKESHKRAKKASHDKKSKQEEKPKLKLKPKSHPQHTKPKHFLLPDPTSEKEYHQPHATESGGYIHPQSINKRKSQQRRGRSFRTPATTMLPDPLSIERALRPLMRSVESRKNTILDEEATVQWVAEERVWWPVLQGEPERWFEVALVVDQSPSMVIWQPTIAELRALFERHGAFRNVRTWGLVTQKNTVRLFAGAGATLNYARPCEPHELIDPIGRRLILVVTDCVSPAWHHGAMIKWLEQWGQANPVAMLQMLPRRLWSGSALREATRVKLQATMAGLPNTKLKMDTSAFWFDDEIPTGLKIPVLTTEPKPFAVWANMIAGKSYAWASGVVFKTRTEKEDKPLSTSIEPNKTELSAAQRVQLFYATASPTAQKLASYLAAAPLTLPVMRLVQRVMLPQSRQVHLAEVFLGSLLKQEKSQLPFSELLKNPSSINYDFHDGARELLLDAVLMPEALKVIKAVSEFLGHRLGQSLDFQALLSDPTAIKGIQLDEQSRPFATIQAEVLRRLGGEYAQLANRIEKELTKARKVPFEEMQEGMVLHGVVTNIKDYGAFVDVGGIVGLLHVMDMTWKQVKHPQEIVNIGDEIDIKVLKIDREAMRVKLGLKQMTDDPWLDIAQRYPKGTRLSGKVANVVDFGCFVEIEEDIQGLVYKSEMDWSNKNPSPSEIVKIGDEIEVIILDIDEKRRRIALGMKQCKPSPWEAFAATYNKHDKVKGTVKSITDFGVFINLPGNIDGLVHLSDISLNVLGEEAIYNYKKGDEVEAVVLAVDAERERIALGIKQLNFINFFTEHPIGSLVKGIVTEVDAKKAIIQLADDVKGYFTLKNVVNVPQVGDEIKVKINTVAWKKGMIPLGYEPEQP